MSTSSRLLNRAVLFFAGAALLAIPAALWAAHIGRIDPSLGTSWTKGNAAAVGSAVAAVIAVLAVLFALTRAGRHTRDAARRGSDVVSTRAVESVVRSEFGEEPDVLSAAVQARRLGARTVCRVEVQVRRRAQLAGLTADLSRVEERVHLLLGDDIQLYFHLSVGVRGSLARARTVH